MDGGQGNWSLEPTYGRYVACKKEASFTFIK